MENNRLQELWTSYIQMERRLKRFKLGKKKETEIQRDYSQYLEPEGISLLQSRLFTQYQEEGDIEQSFRQDYEQLCQFYQSTKLLQVKFNEVATKLRTKLDGNPIINSTQCNVELKSKKIGKSTLQNSHFCKFRLLMKNNKRKQAQILMEKLAWLSNQILSFQKKFVELNFEKQKSIEIKIFINTDLILNITNEDGQINDKIVVKMENLDSKIEETKNLNDSCLYKNEQIVMNQRKSKTDFNDDSELKPQLLNRSKKISFKELVQKINIENKQNEKKQSNRQKLGQEITNPEQKQNNYIQIKQEEVIKYDHTIQNEEHQERNIQIIQKIQSSYRQNQQEVQDPDKKQQITNKTSDIENASMDFRNTRKENNLAVINIGSQDNMFEEQESCQIIFVNQPNQQENQNGIKFEKIDQVINNQNQQNVVEKFGLLKNEEISNKQDADEYFTFQKIQQFYKEHHQSILKERYKIKKKQRQLEWKQYKNLRKQKLIDLNQQRVQERKRQRQIERNIKLERAIQMELEKKRARQKKKDRMKQQKLENKIAKEQLKQKQIQFCKKHNKKQKNKQKNRSFSSQSRIDQFQNSPSQPSEERSQDNNYKQEEQYLDHQQQQSKQNIVEDKCQSEQQQQIEETHLNLQQYHPQYGQYYRNNILDYSQQDQLISQYQFPFAQQLYSSFIVNPYYQYQYQYQNMPLNLIEQQSIHQKSNGQQSINTAQFQFEMFNLMKMGLEHLNPTQYFQFSPLTFLPPESSKGGYKIE
ncbi:unnamed protein product [Paramecium octaurelia]|uniref:Uncharacterized protein n=1 Tax=Paramecium octaurelia TaxID=43137 RepID=A0A8S1S573_PAROT|nr:unnamed protein product [Paramecium octaurelia]